MQRQFIAHTDQEFADRTCASSEYMSRARKVLCRGMSSAARLRSHQIVLAEGHGSRVIDIDGNSYIDLVCGFGPILLGHAPQAVTDAASRAAARSPLVGAPTVAEGELAERLVSAVPSAERVALANTGSEAVHLAIRIARAATDRRAIVRFEGHFHGWVDPMFTNALGTLAADSASPAPLPLIPNTPGAAAPADIVVARWNDLASLRDALDSVSGGAACVIMEPLPYNMGTIEPDAGYLAAVLDLCRSRGTILIFDEVLSGFRLALGGAQERLGVVPDMSIFSKAFASGFPIGAVGGRADVMEAATTGPVRPAGTFAANRVSVAAGLATLTELADRNPGIYTHLDALGRQLARGLRELADHHRIPLVINQVGSVAQLLWNPRQPVHDYASATAGDPAPVAKLAEGVAKRGVFMAPRGLALVGAAHTEADVTEVIDAFAAEISLMAAGAGAEMAATT